MTHLTAAVAPDSLIRRGIRRWETKLAGRGRGPDSVEDSHAIMDAAHERGINLLDTAKGYGPAI
ncbi:hypothetical protein GCM10009744_36560 [Kribbella alba]|uniref:Aldo/keto reductase n=1 Tax=Kribbella alba TaxID=190197 RepID=A0ABN2FEA0_9ACTN